MVTTAPAYHRVLTNRHARADDGAAAKPDVASDADRLGRPKLVASRLGLDRVNRREQLDIRTDLHVVADVDLSNIERDQAEVREGPRTNVDVHAIVDVQRRAYDGVLAHRSEQVAKDLTRCGGVGLARLGILLGELLSTLGHRMELVISFVPVPGEHPLALAPWIFVHEPERTQR